jgi:hypothetical protein
VPDARAAQLFLGELSLVSRTKVRKRRPLTASAASLFQLGKLSGPVIRCAGGCRA